MKRIFAVMALTLLLLSQGIVSLADDHHRNISALEGLTVARAYFDVNIGMGEKLATRLRLIGQTYEQLVAAGVQPDFIVGFRGQASSYVTKGDAHVQEGEVAAKHKVREWIGRFRERGIPIEQCRIAAGFQGLEADDFLPEIIVVQNGYVSMIGYQMRGYSLVPMD